MKTLIVLCIVLVARAKGTTTTTTKAGDGATQLFRDLNSNHWLPTTVDSAVPIGAVSAGNDLNGFPMFVARASVGNEILLAKWIPEKKVAFINDGQTEITTQNIEVFVEEDESYTWIESRYGNVPAGAVVVGHSRQNEPSYVGKAVYNTIPVLGYIYPSDGLLHYSYGGKARTTPRYDVLVRSNLSPCYEWSFNTANGTQPANAILAGTDADGQPIYVMRAYHNNNLFIGKWVQGRKEASIAANGAEIASHSIEVLTGNDFGWTEMSDGRVLPNSVHGGQFHRGAFVFIARTYYSGNLIPGYVHPADNQIHFGFGGIELTSSTYSVLVKDTTKCV